jgi:adenylate cyclase
VLNRKIRNILLSPWLALITFFILVGVKVSDPYFVEMIRLKYYDSVMLDKPIKSEQIVLANISEKTLEKYGQFPFPRNTYANIINDLYSSGAGGVGNTIMFTEPDRFGGDNALAKILKDRPVVLSQTVSDNCSRNNINTRRTGVAVIGDGKASNFLPSYSCVLNNISSLQDSAIGVGVASTLPESDGVVRRVPLLALSNQEYYPAFALEMLRVAAGDPSYQAKINETGVEALRVPQFNTIKTDEYSRVFVNWNYKFDQFDIGDTIPNLKDKIVILGVTAAGITNPVGTPQGAQYPHQVQAGLLQTLINGDSVSIPNWIYLVDYMALLLLAVSLIIISRFKFSIIYIILIISAYFYLPVYLFHHNKILFDVTFNAIAILLMYLHIYTVKFISEYLQKQQIKKQFGTYLSPDLVARLQKNPDLLQLGGDSRELSIMFTDVRGFTTISEHYGKDVQGLTKIMNRYMTKMTKAILDNKGTLDKYIGDAQMAFWNAPLDDKEHAIHAVDTAFKMLKDLEDFNEEIKSEGIPAFGMGLGINTDTVVVGNMGSSQRFDYTCLGDGVNLASRLEGQSKPYGVKIVIGPKTAEYAKEKYQVIELDLLAVKGKTEPAQIYTVLDFFDHQSPTKHKNFLNAYREGDWTRAIMLAKILKTSWKSQLSKYYDLMLERMEDNSPPEGWDGVYRATSK